MDTEELSALVSGLGKAISDSLAANEAAKEAEKKIQAEAEKQSAARHEVIDYVESSQKYARSVAEEAIANYCDKAKDDVWESLERDPRMPRSINYLERYAALVRMDDRYSVLEHLNATLILAEGILNTDCEIDVQRAFNDAANEFAQKIMLLNGICVAGADCMPNSEDSNLNPKASDVSIFPEATKAIDAAFAKSLGDLYTTRAYKLKEIEASKAREKAVDDQIAIASRAAFKAADNVLHSRAEFVAGAMFVVQKPDGFKGGIKLKSDKNLDQVRELAVEVRKSFETFKQVITDNGLFVAFANESAYGACKDIGFDSCWCLDDFFDDTCCVAKPGRKTYGDIPTNVDEDEDGDTLEKSITRMRKFNKLKYFGLLDEDVSQHVDAFWYGFKKLMENINGLFKLDSRAFDEYCNQVSQTVQNSIGVLGESMDDFQLRAFCDEVNNRSKSK